MSNKNIIGNVKNIIFNTYPNVFDFDVKNATNGGSELNVLVTFRKSISQSIPNKIKVTIDKTDPSKYSIKRVYITRLEKIQALKEENLISSFLQQFKNCDDIKDEHIKQFMRDNKEIIESENINKLTKQNLRTIFEIAMEK